MRSDKSVALSNLSSYYAWEDIKKSYKKSVPTWNKEFELPDGSYSVSDIQYYFKYILKDHGEKTDNPSIIRYVNKIENRMTFNIKAVYYLELVTPEIMKLLASAKSKINKDKIVKICLI